MNLGQDLDMIDLMTAANFGTIFLGVESPDEELLKLNRKYQNLSNPAGSVSGQYHCQWPDAHGQLCPRL